MGVGGQALHTETIIQQVGKDLEVICVGVWASSTAKLHAEFTLHW